MKRFGDVRGAIVAFLVAFVADLFGRLVFGALGLLAVSYDPYDKKYEAFALSNWVLLVQVLISVLACILGGWAYRKMAVTSSQVPLLVTGLVQTGLAIYFVRAFTTWYIVACAAVILPSFLLGDFLGRRRAVKT